ncbi:MAG: hypothetical protein IIT46_11860 [Lachnospiraceae bacterium]|nr:hypothetical protein [Lachnospiraceae bacterium]
MEMNNAIVVDSTNLKVAEEELMKLVNLLDVEINRLSEAAVDLGNHWEGNGYDAFKKLALEDVDLFKLFKDEVYKFATNIPEARRTMEEADMQEVENYQR